MPARTILWKISSYGAGFLAYLASGFYLLKAFLYTDWEWSDVLLGALLAHSVVDIGTLLVHWTLDNYFTPQTPVIGQTVFYFREHHQNWRVMFERNYFEGNFENALFSFGVTFIAFSLSSDSSLMLVFCGVACLGGSNITQIHRWAHTSRCNWLVRTPQRLGIFVDKAFHDAHHANTWRNYGLYAARFDRLFEFLRVLETLEAALYIVSGAVPLESRWGLDSSDAKVRTFGERWRRLMGFRLLGFKFRSMRRKARRT